MYTSKDDEKNNLLCIDLDKKYIKKTVMYRSKDNKQDKPCHV